MNSAAFTSTRKTFGSNSDRMPTGGTTHQNANGCHLRLLCARSERPRRRRAAGQRNEFASFQLLTSFVSEPGLAAWRHTHNGSRRTGYRNRSAFGNGIVSMSVWLIICNFNSFSL
jgi:hypothetical protein